MGIEEIRSRISAINAETARLNNQRNQNIGRQETLKKQLNEAFALYKKNYGVDLTSENLQTELDSVTKKKEAELNKIEQILNLINAGNIAEANKLAGVEASHIANDEMMTSNTESIPTPPVQPSVSSIPNDEMVASNTESIPTPLVQPSVPSIPNTTSPVTQDISGVSLPPVAPPVFSSDMVSPPKAPKQVLTEDESLDMGMPALEGFTRSGLGSIALPSLDTEGSVKPPKTPVKDFSAIINGTAFQTK